MTTHAERTTENKNLVVANDTSQKNNANNSTFQFADNRPETITQRKLQKISNTDAQTTPMAQLKNYANNFSVKIAQKKALEEEELLQGKFNTIQKQGLEEEELLQGKFNTIQKQALEEEELLQGKFKTLQRQEIDEEELLQGKFAPIQKKENNTGLPDNLKSGIENLSGHSLDDVKVHYNSDKPAQLNAHAYAQGTDIHLGSGQEKHLPHEAWHVVQQKQGRVKPTMQMQGKVNVNDDVGLEKEADVMGAKAYQFVENRQKGTIQRKFHSKASNSPQALQLKVSLGIANILQKQPVQAMMATSVIQLERKVTNSQAKNMQASLARVFGGKPADYQIDKESGSTFNDNNGKDTTGHHGVKVTDKRDGSQYTCDFHQNGKYYTRG